MAKQDASAPQTATEATGGLDLSQERHHVDNAEKYALDIIDRLASDPRVDKRWLAIAKTHFEEGAMALRRSVSPKT